MDATLSEETTLSGRTDQPGEPGQPHTRLLDGRYKVGRPLARGGMATVYEAIDTRLGRTVAIKVMHPMFAADSDFVARFNREARSAAGLSHPNVVAVYDQGSDGDTVFLAMEYVPGGTLRDLLRHRGRLTPGEALPLYEQMLSALASAHRAGLVHRDVKPENVLITDDGRVKVADFGLARAVASTTNHTSGLVIGTVSYLSPEQVDRGVADARSDVYAAGIVLYEMLVGEKPYRGATPMDVAYQHVHSRVPPPSRSVPGLPADLDTIVARATARDPDLRPRDAAQLLAEVTRVRDGHLLPPAPQDDEQTVPSADLPPDALPRDDTLVVGAPLSRPVEGDRPAGDASGAQQGAGQQNSAVLQLDPRRRRRRGLLAFVVVLLLGAAAAASAYWYVEGRFTETPDVVGQAEEDALATMRAWGLTATIALETLPSETVAVSHVVRTDPETGARILSGGEVLVYLSGGPERFTLPDVAGSTTAEALAALETETMPLEVAARHDEEFSDTIAEGAVVRTVPPSGTSMKRSQPVTLVLSLGREPLTVPDVRDTSLEEATALLESTGFAVTSEEVFSADVEAGLVVAQDTTGAAFRNDPVHLQVSKGPELFAVPGVLGDDTGDAERTLLDAGFTVNIVRVLPQPLTDDIVIRQTPGSGDLEPAGTLITLYVI